ncbi:hypothetical protein LCGC14_2041620 [marine sediment metagenome]|uniref:Uncharacterized protein n=1 Tax=marine sediment metagenome TaxID=412755 RepID=A0A0F9FEC4_9ZZZZ
MPKKWQVDLKDYGERYASEVNDRFWLIHLGLLAIAERLEVIAVEAVKVNRPLLHPEPEMKIGGTDPD